MNPVREAIKAALNADVTLATLLSAAGAIFHQRAPQTAAYPLIVFHRQAGRPEWAFAGNPVQWDLWLVRAVDKAGSASKAEQIAARIDLILNDAALTPSGRTHLYIRRDSDVDYPEQDGEVIYRHVGAFYRVATEAI